MMGIAYYVISILCLIASLDPKAPRDFVAWGLLFGILAKLEMKK
jgi:hypothetical protein